MATPDRTTIKAAILALITKLSANLVADPPTTTKPFRSVQVGRVGLTEFPRPFLAVALTESKVIGVTDDDKIFEVGVTLQLVTDVTAADAHDALLDMAGAVEDYFDSIVDSGVIEGAEGFDDRVWSYAYPPTTAGARVASAAAAQKFVVKVERQQHRVPAS